MKLGTTAATALVAVLVAACGQTPIKPSDMHVRTDADARAPEGTIPPPVQITPLLPPPKPAARPETYSVVVNNVRVQELLFALARDAKLNVDINPDITGTVTLNAIDQTLPQLLARIARQVDMRYEVDGSTLVVMRDSPFLRTYKVDYVSASRNVKMQSTASTQFGGATAGQATGGTATIDVAAENKLWESIVQNLKDILRETDKVIPAGALASSAVPPPPPAPVAPGGAGSATPPPQQVITVQPTYQEAAAVIGNRESGVLYVRATSKQHERIQEFLDQVLAGAKRQVLIEVTVAEVQLRNEYQRGIEWQRLKPTGLQLRQPAIPPTTSSTPGFNPNPFLVGYAGSNFEVTLKLLEQFGDVRVLSSPRLSVMNNQTAILRVTRDIIYFTITPSTQPITIAGGAGATIQSSFTTTPNVAAEGFMMAVLPQINETDAVVLNVRPTIRRQVGSVRDPNPALRPAATDTVAPPQNDIPLFETREFDSILRMQGGEIAVLAGLMQDFVENTDTGIPGIRNIPFIGEALSQRADLSKKTELVIFLRSTVIRDPSIEGDFRRYRDLIPGENFFLKPNPQRVAPPTGPRDRL